MKLKWNIELREELKFLIEQGFTIKKIMEDLDMSYPTLNSEIKRGLTKEEYKNKQYLRYNIVRATTNYAIEQVGLKEIKLILNKKEITEGYINEREL